MRDMMWENRKLYHRLSSEAVSTFYSNENYIDCAAVNFLLSLVIGNRYDLGSPTFLCLSITFLPKYSFFDQPPQTLCEEILCLN